MQRRIGKLAHWALAASAATIAVVSYAATGHASIAMVETYLSLSNPACNVDDHGYPLYSEVQGVTSSGTLLCEAASSGSSALSQCLAAHPAKLYANVVGVESSGLFLEHCEATPVTFNSTAGCTYNVPSSSTCPAGNTAYAWAQGIN
jgi:hypothetical protein